MARALRRPAGVDGARAPDALANGLLTHGFAAGDRLAVYLQNVPQFLVFLLGAWRAGGILVSINPMSRVRELSYLLKDSGARVLVSLEGLYDEVVPDTDVELVLTPTRAASTYVGFAFFKIAAIFEGIHYRAQQGLTIGEGFEQLGDLVPPLVERGHAALD